jgi:hypothetical protein
MIFEQKTSSQNKMQISKNVIVFLVYVNYDVRAAIAASHKARAKAVSPARTSTLTFFFSDDLTRTRTTSLQTLFAARVMASVRSSTSAAQRTLRMRRAAEETPLE